ncbi:MAG: cysteine hydrolase [Firmicutes bacterium]|nr:cysteine hydrolase [Bacillota bacterium]
MSKKALIVIDMLRDFIEPCGKLYIGPTAEKVTQAISEEIKKARSYGTPIIYLCDSHSEDDPEFRMFPPHCVIGTPGAEVVDELRPHPGDKIIPKRRYSGFFQTDLDLTLRELDIDEVVLVGVCTNICNLYTAADARMLNYKVTALKECMSSFDEAAHEFALKEMEQTLGVKVV